MKNDRFVTIRCIFVPVGWDAASPGNEKIRLPNDRTYAGAAAQPLVCLSFPDAFFFCPGTPEPLPVSRRPSASSGTGRTRKAPTLREKCRGIRRSGRSAHLCGSRHGYSGPRIVPSACTPEPLSVSRRPSASSGTGRTRKAPTLREKCRGIRRSGRSAHLCGSRHGYSGPRIVPSACTPEPLSVSRHPSASSDSLFRKPPGPAAPIDRKRLFPACESCLPPAPPLSSAPAPRTASGIPAPVCSVRFAFSNASRPCGPDRPQAPFSGPRIVPSACTAAIFGPGTPEPLSVSRRPSASSGTGRTRKAPTLREKCRGIRRSGRSAHPCGPRHGYSAPPVADGVFSVHRCFSISTNHSGQRHGRRVSLRMNPSTVDPVLSSSPRSFRIS